MSFRVRFAALLFGAFKPARALPAPGRAPAPMVQTTLCEPDTARAMVDTILGRTSMPRDHHFDVPRFG